MKITIKILLLFLTLNLFSCKGTSQENEKPIAEFDLSTVEKFRESKLRSQIINDYDRIFSSAQIMDLGDLIYNYEVKTTRQIVVVTIDDISPYSDIQKFASDLGNYFGVGTVEEDNGLIIVLSTAQRKVAIATGYSTELVLTDAICKNVIDSIMIPEFINENYYEGTKNGVRELIERWK